MSDYPAAPELNEDDDRPRMTPAGWAVVAAAAIGYWVCVGMVWWAWQR